MKGLFFFIGGLSTMLTILVSFLVGLLVGDDMHRSLPVYHRPQLTSYRADRRGAAE